MLEKHIGIRADNVGQPDSLRRADNPPSECWKTARRAPVNNRRAGYHPAPHVKCCLATDIRIYPYKGESIRLHSRESVGKCFFPPGC
jgi:hypothetical protein